MARRLPFSARHSVDHFARLLLVPVIPSITDPVGEAIAAKAGKAHQVDILGIVAMAQMAHQAAKGRGGDIVGKRIERVAQESGATVADAEGNVTRSGLALLLGSTARGLVPGAHCDVLAVKMDKRKKES